MFFTDASTVMTAISTHLTTGCSKKSRLICRNADVAPPCWLKGRVSLLNGPIEIPPWLHPYREAQAEPGENARSGGHTVQVKKRIKRRVWRCLVRKGGLEPPRFYPPDPKSGASANSATFALGTVLIVNATASVVLSQSKLCVLSNGDRILR